MITITRDESSLGVILDMETIVLVVIEMDIPIQPPLMPLKDISLCIGVLRDQSSRR